MTTADDSIESGEALRPPSPTPSLRAEWRLKITVPSGTIFWRCFDTADEAEAASRRIDSGTGASWVLERRLVSEWAPWPSGSLGALRSRRRGKWS